METVEALKWLKENNLYEESKKASFHVKKVFAPCLGVQEEKILIVGDTGSQNRQVSSVLSGAYYQANAYRQKPEPLRPAQFSLNPRLRA